MHGATTATKMSPHKPGIIH